MTTILRTLRALKQDTLSTFVARPRGFHVSASQPNSNRTSVTRIGRQKYARIYPVLLVKADGSTIHIRYTEPRRILQIPVDIHTLPDAERRARLRKMNAFLNKSKQDTAYEDDFSVDDYKKFWKK